MPPYLTHSNNTCYFRQSFPPELRPLLGKHEIKESPGQSYPAAVRECIRHALIADHMPAEARPTSIQSCRSILQPGHSTNTPRDPDRRHT